jgi:hypothetical protein
VKFSVVQRCDVSAESGGRLFGESSHRGLKTERQKRIGRDLQISFGVFLMNSRCPMHEVAIVEMFELTFVAEAPALLPLSGRIGQNIQHGEVGEKLHLDCRNANIWGSRSLLEERVFCFLSEGTISLPRFTEVLTARVWFVHSTSHLRLAHGAPSSTQIAQHTLPMECVRWDKHSSPPTT